MPDMIFTSLFDGPGLFLRHAFPQAFIVSYFGGFRNKTGDDGRLRAIMDFQRTIIAQSDLYFVRSGIQKHVFPPALWPIIHQWAPFVDTEFFCPLPPNPSLFFPGAPQGAQLVTGHMKGSREVQKKLLLVILDLLNCRPDCLAVLTFDSRASLQHWQQLAEALPSRMRQRLFLAGGLDAAAYHELLCASSVYVFPEYENPPLQGMLETMSCETLLMTPVPEEGNGILVPGETMLSYPEEDGRKQRDAICRVLDTLADYDTLRKKAREHIEADCSERVVFFDHLAFILKAYGHSKHCGHVGHPGKDSTVLP